jgi:hypothetical protein
MLQEYLNSQPTITEQLGCNDAPSSVERRQRRIEEVVEKVDGAADSTAAISDQSGVNSKTAEKSNGLLKELENMADGSSVCEGERHTRP